MKHIKDYCGYIFTGLACWLLRVQLMYIYCGGIMGASHENWLSIFNLLIPNPCSSVNLLRIWNVITSQSMSRSLTNDTWMQWCNGILFCPPMGRVALELHAVKVQQCESGTGAVGCVTSRSIRIVLCPSVWRIYLSHVLAAGKGTLDAVSPSKNYSSTIHCQAFWCCWKLYNSKFGT